MAPRLAVVSPPVSSSQEPDWASQLVDTFESAVGTVRSKTSEPATRIVKYIVFALMASGLVVMTLVFLTVGLIRLLDGYLPWGVWLPYLVLSGIFLIVGGLTWPRRQS